MWSIIRCDNFTWCVLIRIKIWLGFNLVKMLKKLWHAVHFNSYYFIYFQTFLKRPYSNKKIIVFSDFSLNLGFWIAKHYKSIGVRLQSIPISDIEKGCLLLLVESSTLLLVWKITTHQIENWDLSDAAKKIKSVDIWRFCGFGNKSTQKWCQISGNPLLCNLIYRNFIALSILFHSFLNCRNRNYHD